MAGPSRLVLAGLSALAGALIVGVVFLIWSARPSIAPIQRASLPAYPELVIDHGAELARVGNCASCHTAPGGLGYAGGRIIRTPFGTIVGSNLTPAVETGIGKWSLAAFRRAMREGVGRNGEHLYPAFPYDRLSMLSDGDIEALYAFLMSRTPVESKTPPNHLIFPLGFRPVLAGWKLLFFRPRRFHPDSTKSDLWNHGSYLVESLAHCGSCHSPRNLFGAEERSRAYAGGLSDGWSAPPLAGRMSEPWSQMDLVQLLTTGVSTHHSAAAGPMGEVSYNLARADPGDVQAIALYVASLQTPPARDETAPSAGTADVKPHGPGEVLFRGACANCHELGAPMVNAGRPPLTVSDALEADSPKMAVQTVVAGVAPPIGPAGPYMPAFGAALTDEEIAQVLAYCRVRFAHKKAWPDLVKVVAQTRRGLQ